MHIVHISSVHNANDPRIRLKELREIVNYGHTATLVTGDKNAKNSNSEDSVNLIHVFPGNSNRLLRLFITSPLAILKAFCIDADIYHFHDPELLPWIIFLKLKSVPIVYDIHEDYVTSIRQKKYLPKPLKYFLSSLFIFCEYVFGYFCEKIIAEKYYSKRHPDSIQILNYPSKNLSECEIVFCPKSNQVIYTGSITEDRGAIKIAKFFGSQSKWRVRLIGKCTLKVFSAIQSNIEGYFNSIDIPYIDKYVPFSKIEFNYKNGKWLAGLALFPDSLHYRNKELTKFFEYMAVGLPIIASNFPVWVDLIEKSGVGLCVDPDNPQEIVAALNWLSENPEEAKLMALNGQNMVRTLYNWESEGLRLINFYLSIKNTSTV